MREILKTKIMPPRTSGAIIPRPYLSRRLNDGLDGQLIFISAPAGYGKSTLIASWISELSSDVYCAWLTLTSDDNDVTCFADLVAAALRRTVPHLTASIHTTFSTGLVDSLVENNGTTERLAPLFNGLTMLDKHLVFVLDDYESIRDCEVHQLVYWMLNHLPTTVTIVIISRVDPPLPLARLRTRAQLTTIRAADLRFSLLEAQEFLTTSTHQQLPTESVASLVERTEGWIAGLQLAGLSLQQHEDVTTFLREFGGDNRNIRQYLVEEVLTSQPEEVQRFLLVTSILERLTAPLCEVLLSVIDEDRGLLDSAVEGFMSAQQVLEYLDQHNVFIVPLDDYHQWYRYHTLFAELLRFHLWREHHDKLPALHTSAARWLEQYGFVNEATTQLLASGNSTPVTAMTTRDMLSFWLRRVAPLRGLRRDKRVAAAANGHAYACAEFAQANVFEIQRARNAQLSGSRSQLQDPLPQMLTKRENEVLELLAGDLSYQEIAERLHLSISTVKTHVTHIYNKLDVHSRDEALEQVEKHLFSRG